MPGLMVGRGISSLADSTPSPPPGFEWLLNEEGAYVLDEEGRRILVQTAVTP